MAGEIKAIETQYKGYRFRSRLEARWAVFFDASGIEFEYEPEGFDLAWTWHGSPPPGLPVEWSVKYLPDFWLPQVSMFAEVKPETPSVIEASKAAVLAETSGRPVLLLCGVSDDRLYSAIEGLEFNNGAWDAFMDGYDMTDAHEYWKDEARFYCYGSGESVPLSDFKLPEWPPATLWGGCEAVVAARSARFEFGEAPT